MEGSTLYMCGSEKTGAESGIDGLECMEITGIDMVKISGGDIVITYEGAEQFAD